MSDPTGTAADDPEAGDTGTGSPDRGQPDGPDGSSTDDGQAEPELGAEDDLHGGSTGALPEG